MAEQRRRVTKATGGVRFIGASVPEQTAEPGGENRLLFSGTNAIEPPHDLDDLSETIEYSSALRQCVEAMAVNVDGFGHRLEPVIDFDDVDTPDRVREIMMVEREAIAEAEARAAGRSAIVVAEPTNAEVTARIVQMRREARREHARLGAFFSYCGGDHSFPKLRRITREDIECTGNGGWEVLRNARGDVARFIYVPFQTVRLLPLERDPIEVEEKVRISPTEFETVKVRRRFRKYLQRVDPSEPLVYFKEFGDPRVYDRLTGEQYDSLEALLAAEKKPANEFIHFRIHNPRSPYGMPRWYGTLVNIRGARAAEEVTYLYFDNKSIPPLALLVSGGKLDPDTVPRIERYVEEQLKGRKNFHKIMVIEVSAKTTKPGSEPKHRPQVELVPLFGSQQEDAHFLKYDMRVTDKVGSSFRIPAGLRGESKEFNRATADAMLRFAEDQVFAPERDDFDHLMNHRILTAMGVRYWSFRSQTPITRDPERLSQMIERLVRVGVLIPEEGRQVAADVFNRPFPRLNEDWTKRPITLTLAGIQTGTESVSGRAGAERGAILEDARRLLQLRDELAEEETRLAAERMRLAREYFAGGGGERVVLEVPEEEFDEWFRPRDAA